MEVSGGASDSDSERNVVAITSSVPFNDNNSVEPTIDITRTMSNESSVGIGSSLQEQSFSSSAAVGVVGNAC